VGSDSPSGGSGNELDAIACPSLARCTAVDTLGNEVTFNPRSPGRAKLRVIDRGGSLSAVGCPSVAECVAVDALGQALTGDPAGGTWAVEPIAGATPLTGVRCPSTAECVAVDSAGDAFIGAGRSAAQIKGWLSKLLVPSGPAAALSAVLRARGYRLSFAALYAARLRVRWYHVPPGGHLARAGASKAPVLVASGAVSFGRRGNAGLKVKLSAAGRRLLSEARSAARSLRLTAEGTFTVGGKATGARATFKLTT
jgi:hypothetical protein